MDEELLKRNTDCVYFLASPFTCKKGVECEYRHNEMARLNPRDCWYWAAGRCLNPTCGFRHPPLDVHSDASIEASSLHNSSMPTSKNGVPCYFYYNGYCNKGHQCPFLHGPADSTARNSKLSLEVSDATAAATKATVKAEVAVKSTEKYASPPEAVVKMDDELLVQQEVVQQLTINDIMEPDVLTPVSAHGSGQEIITGLGSLHLPENLTKADPCLSSENGSESQADDHSEQEHEEWWESSPGFDVLVDGRSENVSYEDEQGYLQALDTNGEDLKYQYLDCGYEDEMDCENRIFLKTRLRESSVCSDDEHKFDIGDYSPRSSGDRKVNQIVSGKRGFLTVELPVRRHNGIDLRDHLRSQRMVHNHFQMHDSKRHRWSYQTDQRRERLQRHGSSKQIRGESASRLGRNDRRLLTKENTLLIAANQRCRSSNFGHDRSRQYHKMKRRPFSDEVARKPSSKRKRYSDVSMFTGPKTLAQIKEERSGPHEYGRMRGNSSKAMSADFEGPKPLCELLKDRKKVAASVVNAEPNGML